MSSGAHLSRYIIQVAIHHYFHTQSHFIKTPWVRNVPFPVFTYFLKLSVEKYDEIPRGKVFSRVLWSPMTTYYAQGGRRWLRVSDICQRKQVSGKYESHQLVR